MIVLESTLTTFAKQVSFYQAGGAAAKIGSSLKSNHHWQI
jgi:hypothetical protein